MKSYTKQIKIILHEVPTEAISATFFLSKIPNIKFEFQTLFLEFYTLKYEFPALILDFPPLKLIFPI